MYRKAFRIVDLECIVRAKQQQEKEPVKRGGSKAALNFEMDRSSVFKKQIVEIGMVVLGLATSHDRN